MPRHIICLVGLALLGIFTWLAGGIFAGREFGWDSAILNGVHRHATPLRDCVIVCITRAGGSYGLASLLGVVVLWLLALRRWNQAAFLTAGYCGGEILHNSLKAIFRRDRPALWTSPAPEYSYSFPSGHALLSAAVLIGLGWILWRTRWRWPALVLVFIGIFAIGFSRVYLGVHYPSDVLGAWSLAGTWMMVLAAVSAEDVIRRQDFRWKRPLLCLVALCALPLAYAWNVLATSNFHVLVPNQAYRAAQMTGAALEQCIHKYGIKSVVNLRGPNERRRWYQEEIEVCRRLGVTHADFTLISSREVAVPELNGIADLLSSTPKPVLIHCRSGADRTGLVSALYLYKIAGQPHNRAERELSVWYGHVPYVRLGVRAMDRSLQAYVTSQITSNAVTNVFDSFPLRTSAQAQEPPSHKPPAPAIGP